MRRLLPLLLLAACDSEAVPVYLLDARDGTYDFTAVEEACDFWGVECVEEPDRSRAVLIIMTRGWSARTTEETKCAGLTVERGKAPTVWTGSDDALYHEMGHVFGLEDLAEGKGGNVMSPALSIAKRVATDEQREHAQRKAAAIALRLN